MVFSSLIFLFIFFPIFLGLYFLLPFKYKNLLLFLSSLLFYAWGEPIYVSIMIFSTLLDYTVGRFIDKYREHKYIPKAALIISIVINLGMLGFFKYSDFFLANINNIFNVDIALLNIALPIGISFYTFQTMSYNIDLYKGKIGVQKNIISFGAYVSMFPQLIAGPIVTYSHVEHELNNRSHTLDGFTKGISRFIEGLGKKVLIANNIGLVWDTVLNTGNENMSIILSWIGIVSFALQLYFDFSGYSDMAIGLGYMMGFNFPENFNYPYISRSATEFWRRWHMTLGSWFREYVYIPLGGNRVSRLRFYLNLLIVWFLTGFWHGAGWNFIIWGLYFAVVLIIEKAFLKKTLDKYVLFSRVYTIIIVLISWVFFSIEDLSKVFEYLATMFCFSSAPIINSYTLYILINYAFYLIVGIVLATPLLNKIKTKLPFYVTYIIYMIILVLSTAFLVNSTFNPFLYFRF